MKRLLFILFTLLISYQVTAQDWRYLKGKKLVTSLEEALKNPANVYNLSLNGHDLYGKDFSGIRNMVHLHYLALDDADLEMLPDYIFDGLSELRTLSMTGNKFTRLPEQIRALKKLEYLVMYDNEMDSIPDWIGELSQLDNLILPRNKIRYLSPSVTSLKKLNYLSLGKNELSSLPEDIGNLSALEYFSAGENRLTAVPASLVRLHKLVTLDLSHNPLQSLPDQTGKLQALQNLQLNHTELLLLPADIEQLKQLKELYLDHNRGLNLAALPALPENLELLNITQCSISQLPECIRNCRQMDQLEAEENQLTGLPEWLGGLKKLRWLMLDDNKLAEIPGWICRLDRLEIFRLTNNRAIDSIPSCLFEIPALEGLSFYGTRIRQLPGSVFKAKKIKWLNVANTEMTLEACLAVRNNIPRSTEFIYDSPFFLEDETVPCYTEKMEYKDREGFSQHTTDPYFKGGERLFEKFLNTQLDTSLYLTLRSQKGDNWTDSVLVRFYIQRKGGLFNIRVEKNGDPALSAEARRLLLLTCRYWVPPRTSGFYITGSTQLVFTFTGSLKKNEHILTVHAHNPLPAVPRVLILEND